MMNKDTPLIDKDNENERTQCCDRKKQIEEPLSIIDPHNFEYEGIKVRVVFEGTADLNELVKGLFMTG